MASVLDLIGDTPLIEVTRLDAGPCRLFLKLESANPSGSIKDRPARAMIEAAEAERRLSPGGTIVEATAGNTGLGLALVGGRKGYRTVLVVPDKMAREKILHAKAMGAEVVLTRSDVGKGHPDYYQDLADTIARETPGAIYINQFANPANPRAHETGTGPELIAQMEGDIDAIVVGVGSGGTLTGVGRCMKSRSPKTEMVLADPAGSVLAPYVETGRLIEAGSWAVEGIGEDFVPPNADLSLVARAYSVAAPDSFEASRELLRREGILAGSSSGTLLAAALRYCRAQDRPKRVVSFVCDSGAKYLSKVFNPTFIAQEGWDHRELHGTVRDVVVSNYPEGSAVVLQPSGTQRIAWVQHHGRTFRIVRYHHVAYGPVQLAVIPSFLGDEGRIEHLGEVFGAGIAHEADHPFGPILRLAVAQRRRQQGAEGRAGEDTLPAQQLAGSLETVRIGDRVGARDQREVGIGRHEVLADAFDCPASRFDQSPGLDIRREHGARRVGQNHLGLGRTGLHAAADAGQRTAGADSDHDGVDVPFHLRDQLWPGPRLMRTRIGWVGKLVDVDCARRLARDRLGEVLAIVGMAFAHVRTREHHLRSHRPRVEDLLPRHLVRHHQHGAIAFATADEGKPEAGIARGRLDDGTARLEPPIGLGRLDHGAGRTVLDRSGRIGALELEEQPARRCVKLSHLD